MPTLWTVSGDPVLIDEEDMPRVQGLRLYILRSGRSRYTIYMDYSTGKQKTMYLHRLIRDDVPKGTRIDHINGDGMDNRRANLRPANASQNGANQGPIRGGSSQYKGITWNKRRRKWYAQIKDGATARHLGVFVNEIDAARAYDAAAVEVYGEFAGLNFPTEARESPTAAIPARTTPNYAGASRFRGVCWHGQRQKWSAKLTVNGKTMSFGLHATEEDAARAYDAAAIAALGDKARLNFPPPPLAESA